MLTEERKAEIRKEMEPVLREQKELLGEVKRLADTGEALAIGIQCGVINDTDGWRAAMDHLRSEVERLRKEKGE